MNKAQAKAAIQQARSAAKACRAAGVAAMEAKHIGEARHFGHMAKSAAGTERWTSAQG